MEQPEEINQYKIPLTASVIEPATFQLVARCLNQISHNFMKIWAFQLEHARLCEKRSEPPMKGR